MIKIIEVNTIKNVNGFCSDLMTISSNSVAVLFVMPEKNKIILFLTNYKDRAINSINAICVD